MDVVISMEAPKGRKVYHRSGCIYEKRILTRNKMIVTKAQAKAHKYHSCKYCSGLIGEIRTNEQIPIWEEKYHIKINYIKQTNMLYIRTRIGCWKICYNEEIKSCLLYHRIINEMICNAWYSVREFHIHLSGMQADGQVRDGLERAVLRLAELSDCLQMHPRSKSKMQSRSIMQS